MSYLTNFYPEISKISKAPTVKLPLFKIALPDTYDSP